MQHEYMPLVRVCDALLKNYRKHLNAHLIGVYPDSTLGMMGLGENPDLSLMVMVSGILEDAVAFALGHPKLTESPQLEIMAHLFEAAIKERSNGAAELSYRRARQLQDAKVKERMEAMDADLTFSADDLTSEQIMESYHMPSRELRGLNN